MQKLPLRVQVSIRDSWDKDDSPIQVALSDLKEVLGINVVVDPQWQLLLAELDNHYPDKSTFVPTVAGCVRALLITLKELAEGDETAEWADKLLDHVGRSLRIFLEASEKQSPIIKWCKEREGLILALPKGPAPSPIEVEPLFKKGLLDCFEEPAPSVATVQRPTPSDDWADVSMDIATTEQPAVVDRSASIATSKKEVKFMPGCDTLARPDELFLKPPYHLTITHTGNTFVEVQCSHSPTLQLLADYLKKWCRTNHQDSRNIACVDIKLHQSSFCLGLMYDRLTLEVNNRYHIFSVSPMIILPFVEGILRYQSVSTDVNGRFWHYRKDAELKKHGY